MGVDFRKTAKILFGSVLILFLIAIGWYGYVRGWFDFKTAELTGAVSYREKIALPDGSQVEVQLRSDSIADKAEKVIAKTVITTSGQSAPIPFILKYNPTQIKADSSYSVFARILVDGQPRWITEENASFEVGKSIALMLTSAGSGSANRAKTGQVTVENLEGKSFRILAYNGTAAPVESNWIVTFRDGVISARVCNSMSGNYLLNGDKIKGVMVMTEMACMTPAGIMDAESALTSLLSATAGATINVINGDITLVNNDKDVVLREVES